MSTGSKIPEFENLTLTSVFDEIWCIFEISFGFCIAPYYAYVEIIEIGFNLDCLIFWSWAT